MAKIKTFRAEYGTSVEVKGTWHKLNCAVEIEIEAADNFAEVKEKAWNTVYAELEKQLAELI